MQRIIKKARLLAQFAAFLSGKANQLQSITPLRPRLQVLAHAIGDQCCADLETIAYWQQERRG